MDAQREQERTQTYKTIRTGVDEMNFVMLEDVNQPIETGTVLVSRGGVLVQEQTIEPTAEQLVEIWIEMGAGGNEQNKPIWCTVENQPNGSTGGVAMSGKARKRKKEGEFNE